MNLTEVINRIRKRLNPQAPEIKTSEKDLEDILDKQTRKTIIYPEEIIEFGDLSRDYSPIHRILEEAKKMGFKDTPVMGTHLAMIGEQFAVHALKLMKEYWGEEGRNIKIIGQDTKFRNPVYPGDKLTWTITGYRERQGSMDLSIQGSVGKTPSIDITAKLGNPFELMPQIASPIPRSKEKNVYSIDDHILKRISVLTGGEDNNEVPNMLPPAFIPGILLSLMKERSQETAGINVYMNFSHISNPTAGEIQGDIYRIAHNPAPRNGNYFYQIRTVCGQTKDSRPLNYGEILVATKSPIILD